MIGKEILSKKFISLSEIKTIVSERKKEKDLKYEQDQSLKYTKEFAKITDVKAKKLIEDLMKINGMTERLSVKIADIAPEEIEIMQLLPLKEENVSDETLKEALETVKKYVK